MTRPDRPEYGPGVMEARGWEDDSCVHCGSPAVLTHHIEYANGPCVENGAPYRPDVTARLCGLCHSQAHEFVDGYAEIWPMNSEADPDFRFRRERAARLKALNLFTKGADV